MTVNQLKRHVTPLISAEAVNGNGAEVESGIIQCRGDFVGWSLLIILEGGTPDVDVELLFSLEDSDDGFVAQYGLSPLNIAVAGRTFTAFPVCGAPMTKVKITGNAGNGANTKATVLLYRPESTYSL